MKRYVGSALLLAVAIAGTALAQSKVPVRYPYAPGATHYYHGDEHPVRPVYQQPLQPPDDSHEFFGESLIEDFGGSGCDVCDGGPTACSARDCARPWDMWVRAEYLLWWSKGSRLPPLLTTATGTGSGILGDADTQIVIGGDVVHRDERSGGRFTLGAWLDDAHCTAIEANFFFLGDATTELAVESDGSPLLARPFFNVELQQEAAQLIASPGVSTGSVLVAAENRVHGGELLMRRRLGGGCHGRVDGLFGYRYAGLDESLVIRDELVSVDPTSNVPVGTVVGGFDSFETFNQFHGGQLGLAIDLYHQRWTLGMAGKVALGNMRQQVTIGGTTFVAVPGAETTEFAGGLLTQPSNIGGFFRDEFAVIPEGQLNLRYCLTRNLEFSVGYTIVYFSDVVRPGEHVDRRVDPRQITDPENAIPLPSFDFVNSDFWVQGINFGLEYKF